MAKTKISEYSATSADNTDISNINIAEGCSPANVNNAIRTLMAQIKDLQAGTSGDTIPVTAGGTGQTTASLAINALVPSQTGNSGKALVTNGTSVSWGAAFVSGMIMLWSGSSATIPSGWLLCDGTNSTPDLRNRFVVGATSTYAVGATGGSADAIVVSHSHTTTVTDAGHQHASSTGQGFLTRNTASGNALNGGSDWVFSNINNTATSTTGITVSANTTGSSGTNANLPPYYALCYIMKS
jgi:hypothetical protein